MYGTGWLTLSVCKAKEIQSKLQVVKTEGCFTMKCILTSQPDGRHVRTSSSFPKPQFREDRILRSWHKKKNERSIQSNPCPSTRYKMCSQSRMHRLWWYQPVFLQKMWREGRFTVRDVGFQLWDVWMGAPAPVAPKFHCQYLFITAGSCWSMLLNLLNDINRITKKRCGEGVPVLLVFQARGVKILTNNVKMQLPHRWNL